MRVAVTGGTGFVGIHTVRALKDAGHEVVVVARGTVRQPKGERVTFVKADVTNSPKLAEIFTGCDAVVHLVAVIREKGRQTFDRVNREATVRVTHSSPTCCSVTLASSGKLVVSALRLNRSCGVSIFNSWCGRSVLYSTTHASSWRWRSWSELNSRPLTNSRRKVQCQRSILPVVVGLAGLVRMWLIPFSRQILSKRTSESLRPKRPVKTLPLSVSISSGTPQRVSAATKCSQTGRAVARAITPAQTMKRL